jgi:hypothetical protein
MSVHQHPTAAIAPPAAAMRVLERFERRELEGFIAVAIDLLDTMAGDPEAEEDDDPGQCDEDELNTDLSRAFSGEPGCPISDPDMGAEDYACDPEEDQCTAGDDGCGPVLVHGHVHWGAGEDGANLLPKPVYGIDQTKGPIDYRGGGYEQ